jgi:hypothetical protein
MLQVNPTRINRCDDPRRCLRFLEQEGRLFTLEGMAPLQVAKGVAGMEQEMKHQAADHLFNINWIYVSRNTIYTYNIQFTYRNIFILYIYIYILCILYVKYCRWFDTSYVPQVQIFRVNFERSSQQWHDSIWGKSVAFSGTKPTWNFIKVLYVSKKVGFSFSGNVYQHRLRENVWTCVCSHLGEICLQTSQRPAGAQGTCSWVLK